MAAKQGWGGSFFEYPALKTGRKKVSFLVQVEHQGILVEGNAVSSLQKGYSQATSLELGRAQVS